MLGAFPALLIGLSFGLGKIVRDCSLTCNIGFKLSPLAILAVGLASLPVSSITLRSAGRMGYKRWQTLSLGAIAASFFLFWAATFLVLKLTPQTAPSDVSGRLWTFPLGAIYLCFFVWIGALGAALKPNIKSTIYRLFPPHQQAKALAVTTAAVILGGLIGAWTAGRVAPAVMRYFGVRYELARDSLILMMGLLMLLCIPAVRLIARVNRESDRAYSPTPAVDDPDTAAPALDRLTLRNGIRIVMGESKLKRMASLIVATGVAESIILYLFYWLVSEQVPATAGRTLFFSDFYIWLNAWTLVFLVFGSNRLINRFGLFLALAALPFALFLGTAYLLYHSAVAAMYVVRIIYSSFEQSLYGQGLDRMMLDIDPSQEPIARPLLHGLAIRVGRGGGALLVLLLALGAGISFSHLTIVLMILLLIWLGIALSLKGYLHRSSPMAPPLHQLRATE